SSFVEYEPSEAGLAPLHFDPTAPLRPPPVTVVEPATDLVDGQVVHLAGSGFEPNSFVYVLQCPAGTAEPELCHLDAPIFARTDGDGRFEGYVSVLAVFEGFGGPVDCRVDGCSMVVAEDLFGRRSDTSLAFAPDGPLLDPSLTVTPHARLEGGDTVTVTGRSWPQTTLAVVQCLVGSTFRGCDLDRASFLVPGAGPLDRGSLRPVATTEATAGPGTSFVEPYDVRTGFGGREGEPVDCEVQPCELRVFAFSRELQRSVALGFRPGVVGPVTARPAFAG
ncbi:MAG TPA: neocarzinostatin apoprotein domain-containing protein, partial [Acidimicrobiales bacterium]|nr:neocarzinostatin apoprotein domain-containing protein [Acidimicrobiales bacterium]